MSHVAVGIQLAPDAAHFFVAHFRFQTIVAQDFHSLFQSGPDVAPGTGPVLFLHDLGRRQGFGGNVFRGGLDPEFQFRCGSGGDLFHIFRSKGQTGDFAFGLHGLQDFIPHITQGFFQQITGIHEFPVVFQEAGNTQGPHHLSGFRIDVVHVVVHEPVHGQVGHHIHTGVVQRSNPGQHHGRAVGLGRMAVEHGIHVVQQSADGYFFVGVVPGKVNAHEGHKFDFRMLSE